jgi:hypothetical protein
VLGDGQRRVDNPGDHGAEGTPVPRGSTPSHALCHVTTA